MSNTKEETLNTDLIFDTESRIIDGKLHMWVRAFNEQATHFKPHYGTEMWFIDGVRYSHYDYYTKFDRYTYRYKKALYKIKLPKDFDSAHMQDLIKDYITLIMKYRLQPEVIEPDTYRFNGTREPTDLDKAERAKAEALKRFAERLQ